jgi:hypothetical protein
MRLNNRCPACNRIFKKSHDRKIADGKPYSADCITFRQYRAEAVKKKKIWMK